jgi:membrane protein YqaA with SNARE-associated domain
VGLAFLWGLAEATFFFVVPDVPISLAALFRPRRAWRHVVAAVVGAVIGGALMFGWAAQDAKDARDAVARVPFVKARMFAHVHASYQAHGAGAIFLGPLTGTPYKIYAVEAPEFIGRGRFLLNTAPARGERFVFVWAVFGALGTWLRRSRKWTTGRLAVVPGVFWVLFYAVNWSLIAFR